MVLRLNVYVRMDSNLDNCMIDLAKNIHYDLQNSPENLVRDLPPMLPGYLYKPGVSVSDRYYTCIGT